MFGERKPFSRDLHQSNDPKSRRIIIEYFQKKGIPLQDNKNQYGVDLVSADGAVRIEVEHRISWRTDEWSFPDINVPERKAKFLSDGVTAYAILSCDFSHMGIIQGQDVKPFIVDTNLHLNKNKYVKNGEYFYKLPISKFKWVTL